MCDYQYEPTIEYAISTDLIEEALKAPHPVKYLNESLAPIIVIPKDHLSQLLKEAQSLDREDWRTFNGHVFFEVYNDTSTFTLTLTGFIEDSIMKGETDVEVILKEANDLGYVNFTYWGIYQTREEIQRRLKLHQLWY